MTQTTHAKETMMYVLTDTFNGREISRHRTLRAALVAAERDAYHTRKANGSSSYIPTMILDSKTGDKIYSNGSCSLTDLAYTRIGVDGQAEYGLV